MVLFEENFIGKGSLGTAIVQNDLGEILGYGKVSKQKNKLILNPIKDRGDFLRRE
jgi:ribosome biogenesis protein Nip4